MKKLVADRQNCLLSDGLGGHAEGMDSSDSSEYLIKAGFIYNFAN